MGNTNLPQAGAANMPNSRDTLSGEEQLTDAERWERDHGAKSRGGGFTPNRSTTASTPHEQRADTDTDTDTTATPDSTADTSHKADELAPDDPYNPRNTTGAGDPPAQRSHIHTGHSPSDAT